MTKLSDKQEAVEELRSEVEDDFKGLFDDLDNAAICENTADCTANLASAEEGARNLLNRIIAFRKEHE